MAQSNVNSQTQSIINEPRLSLNSNSSSGLPGSTNQTGLSLLYSIIKTLQKYLLVSNQQSQKNTYQIQKYAFTLLTNCAQSNECKNIIWKSNLLQDFATIDFPSLKANSAKYNYKKEKLWLLFLVSLSFSQDGQQFFLKVDSLLNTLIKFHELILTSSTQHQQYLEMQYFILLMMRNISFNQANKSKLVSHGRFFLLSKILTLLFNINLGES